MDRVPLHLDQLCYVPGGSVAGSHVCGLVKNGFVNQVQSMGRLLQSLGGPSPARALHFHPALLAHPITLVLPVSRDPSPVPPT